jgi:hypothetical protein
VLVEISLLRDVVPQHVSHPSAAVSLPQDAASHLAVLDHPEQAVAFH